jgi:TetR/AcrR family transcriptional regulator
MVKSEGAENKILEAARKVFIKKGLAGARMQEIADEADINKALLHYYFRSKEKLFEKIFNEVFKAISVGLSEVLNSDSPVFEKLQKFIDLYIGVLAANPYMPVFVLNEMSQNPERIQKMLEKDILPSVMHFFTQMLQEINVGKIKPIHPTHLVLNIIGMMVIPYAVKPMIAPILKDSMGIDYNDILDERKQVIFDFVYNALKINENDK